MTRAQLFVTLSFVFCAITPCADGMSAAPSLGPIGPDSWWPGFNEMRATVAASLDGTTARIVEGVLAVLLAWHYRSLLLAQTGRQHRSTPPHYIVADDCRRSPRVRCDGRARTVRQPPQPPPPSPMPSQARAWVPPDTLVSRAATGSRAHALASPFDDDFGASRTLFMSRRRYR